MSATLQQRDSLNGSWILDKSRENWSMNEYLKVMKVDPLAIEAHSKGDASIDTIHTIRMTNRKLSITKESRVNHNLVVELEWNREHVETLSNNNDTQAPERYKKSTATKENDRHIIIESTLDTLHNGMAKVTDEKVLEDNNVLKQTLTIVNLATQEQHTTVRYFIPHDNK